MQAAIIAIIGALIAGAAPVVRAWVKTRLTTSRMAQVGSIAKGAVRAAEKLATVVPGTTGQAKLDFATSVVVAGAKRLGLRLTDNEVLSVIHFALAEVDTAKAALS